MLLYDLYLCFFEREHFVLRERLISMLSSFWGVQIRRLRELYTEIERKRGNITVFLMDGK